VVSERKLAAEQRGNSVRAAQSEGCIRSNFFLRKSSFFLDEESSLFKRRMEEEQWRRVQGSD
jgi:hypothetical protein